MDLETKISMLHSREKAIISFISIFPLKFSKYANKFWLKVKFHSLRNPYLSYNLDQMMFGVPYCSLNVEKSTFWGISKGLKNGEIFPFLEILNFFTTKLSGDLPFESK